jgi:thiol-disulfide isomerase/thioredoxin
MKTPLRDTSIHSAPRERHPPLAVRRPFNIGGTTWEIADLSATGTSFRVAQSARHVAETLPPPDLGIGKIFPSFNAVDMSGAAVHFPSDFKGKVVMLDFWATWCSPCMDEVPGVVNSYRRLSAKGFEILGVTLDDAGQAAHVKDVMKAQGMSWRQIYDGGGWQAALAVRFLVTAIPAAFLVDGDTGEILASEGMLRGDALRTAVERALRDRGKL